jgi:tetratricopeptide (TPR) repeat protein
MQHPEDPGVDHAGPYKLENFLFRDSIGLVFRTHDPEQGRPLAVKVLDRQLANDPAATSQFAGEADHLGRLLHPGLPSVFPLNYLEDGRPYYVMALLEGKTLVGELCKRENTETRFNYWFNIVVRVAQTIGYIHRQGMLHGQLTSGNVQIGEFGEVQVMPRAESGSADLAPGANDWSYLAPEQVRGEQIDTRTDVYAIGAILAEILIGAPPLFGNDPARIFEQLSNNDLGDTFARLDGCGADPDLIALTKRCLSPDRAERPADAQVVAEELLLWQDSVRSSVTSAPRIAPPPRGQLVILGIGLAVFLGLLAFGNWLFVPSAKNADPIKADQSDLTDAQLAKAKEEGRLEGEQAAKETAAKEIEMAKEEARQEGIKLGSQGEGKAAFEAGQKDSAVKQLKPNFQQLGDLIHNGSISEARAMLPRMTALIKEAGDQPEAKAELAARQSELEILERLQPLNVPQSRNLDATYAEIFRKADLDLDKLTPAEATKRIEKMPIIKSALLAALDDWSVARLQSGNATGSKRLLTAASAIDADKWRDEVRKNLAAGNIAQLEKASESPEVGKQRSSFLHLLAEGLHRAGKKESALALLKSMQWRSPGDGRIAWNLARWREEANRSTALEEVIRDLGVASTAAPMSAMIWQRYGERLLEAGFFADADFALRKSIDLQPDLGGQYDLARLMLRKSGFNDEAKQMLNKGLGALSARVKADPKDTASWAKIGQGRELLGEFAAALEAYAKAGPTSDALRSHARLLTRTGKRSEAVAMLQQALKNNPEDAKAMSLLGELLFETGKAATAAEMLCRSLTIDPMQPEALRVMGRALSVNDSRAGEASEARREGLLASQELLRRNPNSVEAYWVIGQLCKDVGNIEGARDAWLRLIELDASHVGRLELSALLMDEFRLYNQSAELAREALTRVAPEHRGLALSHVAVHQMEEGKLAEAQTTLAEARKLDPTNETILLTEAELLRAQGKLQESLDAYRKLDSLQSSRWIKDGPTDAWVKQAERLVAAEKTLNAVSDGSKIPATTAEMMDSVMVCVAQQKYVTATRLMKEQFARDPNGATSRRMDAIRFALLAAAGRGEQATKLRETRRPEHRKLALDWLTEELNALKMAATSSNLRDRQGASLYLNLPRTHPDFASVRDAKLREKLPAEERKDWENFWREVETLSQRLQ